MFAVCLGGVGALLTWRHPGHPVGWILAGAGLVSALNFATIEYGLAGSAGRRHLPAAEYAGWVQLWIWVPLIALITVYLFLLFPDGHLPSPRWRPVGWLAAAPSHSSRPPGLAFSARPRTGPTCPGCAIRSGSTPAAVPFDAVAAGLAGAAGLRGARGVVAGGAQSAGHRGAAAPDQVARLHPAAWWPWP